MAKQTPKETIRIGRGIKAAIWENNGKNGNWYNVTICRTYRDQNGNLQDTTSFGRDDLPFVEKAAAHAFAYLLDLPGDRHTDEADSAE